MPMVRAMRMLNAVEAGTLSGAQFEDMLSNPGRLGEWNVLLGMRGQLRRIVASSTTMTAIAASSTAINTVISSNAALEMVVASGTAMAAIAADNVAMSAVVASGTAMAAIAADNVAMSAVVASSTAKLALYESDTALTACFNSTTAMAALRAAATIYNRVGNGITAVSLTTGTNPVNLDDAGKYILLGVSGFNSSTRNITVSTPRSGTTRPNTISNAGHSTTLTAGALACCPITGPLTFVGNSTGTGQTYFSLLRCDV